MTDSVYVLTVLGLMAAVTFALRGLPFIAGRWLRRHALVHKLGSSLPLSIMVLLLIDSAVGQVHANPAGPWQELLAVALVVLLQWRMRQPLLSIVVGTALYVALRAL